MDQSKVEVKLVGQRSGTLGTTSIGGDNNSVLIVNILANVVERRGLGVQVVNGHVKKALDLTCMQVHSDDMVAASRLQHVSHKLSSDGCTRLVLLVLASVGEVGNHGGDSASAGSLACVDHDEQFHQVVIDLATAGLDNENVLISNRLTDGNGGLLVGVLRHSNSAELKTQARGHGLGQLGVGVTREQLDGVGTTVDHYGYYM